MATQNINNFYFNKLDAKLDFSSYHDFFLASDERDYNWEVVYSKYPIGVYGNESSLINGIPFSSSVLGSWFDLNVNDCAQYTNLTCSSNNDDNTLLSLSYWDKAKPTIRDAKCSCTTCETAEYANEADYVKTICDVGLTGVDNGLTDHMKGIDNTCNMCEREFVITGTSNGTMVGITISGTSSFTPVSWSSNLPFQPTCVTTCTYPNVAVVGGFVVSEVGTVTNDNLDSIVCTDLTQASCCFMTGGTAYSFTLSNAKLVSPLISGSTYGVFTATTIVNSGYLSVPCDMDKMTLWETLPSYYEFDRLKYDKRLKLTPVGAGIDTGNNLSYKMTSVYESSTGYYQQLDGGFYQGFYKLEGQPYEVLPPRTECGWTVDNTIKVRTGAVCGGNTLNGKYPNNAGFFWYMGARAENKFWNVFSGESGTTTCDSAGYNCSGETTTPIQQTKDSIVNDRCHNRKIIGELETYDHKIDSMSNAFGLRLTPDYRIGFRALYYTSSCVISGGCVTARTYTTGYTIVEEYSDLPVCGLESPAVVSLEPWLLVTARFERNFCYDGCDLENKGGVNDLRVIDTPLGDTTNVVREKIETSIEFHQNWMDERKYRLGTLTIFVNGRPALVVEDFEEIIPRRLNTDYRLQVGVPYNMSWGGGSQGLLENLTFSGTTCTPYRQDNKDLGLLIESNFAGTYDGGISQMRYYIKPLTDDEVIHNYLVNKDRYDLKDCECDFTICREGRTIYRTEGDSVDLDITFAAGMNEVAVDKLGDYINSDEWTGVKFTNVTIGDVTNNVTGYSFQVIEDMGTGTIKNVSIPFHMGPNEIIKIIINKININIEAKIILYGNLYK